MAESGQRRHRGQIVVKGALTTGQSILLTGGSHKNLLAWKPRVAEAVTVCAEEPAIKPAFTPPLKLFRARVTELDEASSRLFVFEEMGELKKPPAITLLQALPEKERMELIIEKTTELGVTTIVPFKSERSISIEEREAKQRKAHRWGEVALRAAKQSRRCSIPDVLPYRGFEEALGEARGELKIVLWEGAGLKTFKEVLNGADVGLKGGIKGGLKGVDLLVGPEGGFGAEEVEAAGKEGFIAASLGPNILRTETAAIISVGLTGYEFSG